MSQECHKIQLCVMPEPMRLKKSTFIFSDGACSGNPGPGGWGAILAAPDDQVLEIGGRESETTNNRMELTAVIQALTIGKPDIHHPIQIYADSTYVIRGITQWVWKWIQNDWTTAEGKKVLNRDLWEKLAEIVTNREITWKYVPAHSGIPGNERADQIAVSFAQQKYLSLYRGPSLQYPIAITDIPEEPPLRKLQSCIQKKPTQPYSYLSLIENQWKRHSTWAECEKRVKGQRGARFKKAMTLEEEREILKQWGFIS